MKQEGKASSRPGGYHSWNQSEGAGQALKGEAKRKWALTGRLGTVYDFID